MFSGVLHTSFSIMDAPEPWQCGFQDPATHVMEGIIDLHHLGTCAVSDSSVCAVDACNGNAPF